MRTVFQRFLSIHNLRNMDQWNSTRSRSPVYATNGIVATSQPLASEVGLSILKKGGNAADAAVAVAASLNVTQPTSTGIGGDMFCLFYNSATKSVSGINGSGRCPADLTVDVLNEMGYNEANRPTPMSPLWITVPGAAAGWVDTVLKFGSGKLTLSEILTPAINLAENGYPVSDCAAYAWKKSEKFLLESSANGNEILIHGKAPEAGQIMKMESLANTFRLLGSLGKQGFYEGKVADAIVEVIKETGGIMNKEDLAQHQSTFEDPICVNYRGIDVYECPPNGQGITALVALNILEGFNLSALEHNSADHIHLMAESLRLAFADTRYYVADPKFSRVPTEGLLSKDYAADRRSLIRTDRAAKQIEHGYPVNSSNTVYFSVVDGEGNACSFINSNYMGFGTHIVPKECGFTLQNRGNNFSLDINHANSLEPNKRPYHTIIPGIALKDGNLWSSFGVMGSFMQPQGHLQVLSGMIDFHLNPQQALDAPRFRISDGTANGSIVLEHGIADDVRDKLILMGHKLDPYTESPRDRQDYFGTGQIIKRDSETGVICAGSDHRHDGLAIGW